MLPQRNARLIDVERGGLSEDYDADASGAQSVLTYTAPAYLYEKRESRRTGEDWDRVAVRYLLVDPVIEFAVDDTVQVVHAGSTFKAKVASVRNSQITGLRAPVRLELA